MVTLDACLKDQYLKGMINIEDAIAKSSNPHEFEKLVGKA
jgi:Tfp pilus assembly pilus retraction ATPase PilT